MVEPDGVADLEAVRRVHRDALVALLHVHLTQHLDRLARRRQLFDAGILNQVDPGRRAAVHDGHFGMVELDAGVVDAQAAKRRQEVLDGIHGRVSGDQARLQVLLSTQM